MIQEITYYKKSYKDTIPICSSNPINYLDGCKRYRRIQVWCTHNMACCKLSYIIGGIIIRVLEKSVFDFDYEQADKDNALPTPYEVMDYKNEQNEN